MVENSNNDNEGVLRKLDNIMKCDICNSKYDYNIHRPLIVKCGHTFCKNCIYNNNQKIINRNANSKSKKCFTCPIDNINHIFSLEKNINIIDPTIYPNLKLEIILKEILNKTVSKIKEKYIIYSKPDIKRNKSPENNIGRNNSINSNNNININKDKNENVNIKINSGNQIINVNAINVNIETSEKSKKNKIDNKNNDSYSNDDLNNLQINQEINLNDKKLNFESDKINDDSIETIPYEEKSMTNMSFRDDLKELLNKNDEIKSQVSNNLNIKTDENTNEIFLNIGNRKNLMINPKKNNNDKINKEIETYNKKVLIIILILIFK